MEPRPPRYPYVCLEVSSEDAERWSAELWELGATGLEERDAETLNRGGTAGLVTLVAAFDEESQARAALDALGDVHAARIEFVEGDAWRDEWKRFFKPKRFGKRIVITPPWIAPELQSADLCIEIEPGNAFGSGMHETTGLVLAELERVVESGSRVLDVGCGSGILAVVAAHLGATDVVAVDIEEAAVVATRENASRNKVPVAIDVSTRPLAEIRGEFDVVLANIQAHVIEALREDLVARVAPGGTLILSGILVEQGEALRARFPSFASGRIERDGEWVSIILGEGV